MFGAPSRSSLSVSRHLIQTGEKTAQTSDIVITTNAYPTVVSTTPDEPNVLPFWFSGTATKSGEAAIVPPITTEASRAPGRSGRRPILRWRSRCGTNSQKAVDARIQTGTRTAQPAARRPAAET